MDTTSVIGELRIPDSVRRAYRSTPGLATAFIGLAVVDVVARILGLLLPAVDLDLARPLSVLSSFLPRDLLIALPAVIVLRLPSAVRVTPWVVGGAVVVALGTLLERPLGAVVVPISMGFSAAAVIPAIGWVAMGWGLTALNPKTPPPTVAGAANLVGLMVVVAAAVLALLPLVIPRSLDLHDPAILRAVLWIGITGILGAASWAFFLRAVVRGYAEPRRLERATSLGTFAALIAAVFGLAIAILTTVGRINPGLMEPIAQSPLYVPLFWLASGGATSLLVLAFGLGLADPMSRVGGMALD